MQRIATVNYHVHKPEPQAFRIDVGGVAGAIIAPELAPTSVRVSDVRAEASASFAEDSVAFLRAPSEVTSFADAGDWQSTYEREVIDLLSRELTAREVVVFDHTRRVDDSAYAREPARNVHSDYSQEGANKRLIDILGAARAQEWSRGHFAFVNVWRPIGAPVNSAPLGFVRPSSVSPEDWIVLDLLYPDRVGQIMGLVANDNHEWIYRSKMAADEVAVFNIYDNRGRPAIGHSALELIEDESVRTVRKSIETRTLVRYGSGSRRDKRSDQQ